MHNATMTHLSVISTLILNVTCILIPDFKLLTLGTLDLNNPCLLFNDSHIHISLMIFIHSINERALEADQVHV